jgi:hypothetical protein
MANTTSNPSYFVEIPNQLYSESTSQKFSFCIECDQYLLHSNIFYSIHKAIKSYKSYSTDDTIIEFAICRKCEIKLNNTYSKSSMKNLIGYYKQNFDYHGRTELLKNFDTQIMDKFISVCAFKNISIEKLEYYQIYSECRGSELIVSKFSPFILSEIAMEEMINLLSNKTIDSFNDFLDKFIGIPPEFKDVESRFVYI